VAFRSLVETFAHLELHGQNIDLLVDDSGRASGQPASRGGFTIHGLRRTFNDLAQRAAIDPIVTRSLTGHVTEQMRERYSTVCLDEKRQAVAAVVRLVKGA
jgi:integrase